MAPKNLIKALMAGLSAIGLRFIVKRLRGKRKQEDADVTATTQSSSDSLQFGPVVSVVLVLSAVSVRTLIRLEFQSQVQKHETAYTWVLLQHDSLPTYVPGTMFHIHTQDTAYWLLSTADHGLKLWYIRQPWSGCRQTAPTAANASGKRPKKDRDASGGRSILSFCKGVTELSQPVRALSKGTAEVPPPRCSAPDDVFLPPVTSQPIFHKTLSGRTIFLGPSNRAAQGSRFFPSATGSKEHSLPETSDSGSSCGSKPLWSPSLTSSASGSWSSRFLTSSQVAPVDEDLAEVSSSLDESEWSERGSCDYRLSADSKSNKAKLVDMWIESALLISRPPLDRKHFDRETRQNLKKMRPSAAQQALSDIADKPWDGIADIAKEVHRIVSHAKAQDKYASSQPASSVPRMSYRPILGMPL